MDDGEIRYVLLQLSLSLSSLSGRWGNDAAYLAQLSGMLWGPVMSEDDWKRVGQAEGRWDGLRQASAEVRAFCDMLDEGVLPKVEDVQELRKRLQPEWLRSSK